MSLGWCRAGGRYALKLDLDDGHDSAALQCGTTSTNCLRSTKQLWQAYSLSKIADAGASRDPHTPPCACCTKHGVELLPPSAPEQSPHLEQIGFNKLLRACLTCLTSNPLFETMQSAANRFPRPLPIALFFCRTSFTHRRALTRAPIKRRRARPPSQLTTYLPQSINRRTHRDIISTARQVMAPRPSNNPVHSLRNTSACLASRFKDVRCSDVQ